MARQQLALAFIVVIALMSLSPSVAAQNVTVTVRIGEFGVARGTGTAVVPVFVTCSGGEVREALLTLSQDDQRIFGQGGLRGVDCDGEEHRYVARVNAFGGDFHSGEARASAYVLICGPSACPSDGDSRTLMLHGRPAQ